MTKNTMSQGILCWIALILSLQRRNEPVTLNGITHWVLEEKKLSLICGTRVTHVLPYATVRYIGTPYYRRTFCLLSAEFRAVAVVILLLNFGVLIGLPDCTVLYNRISNVCLHILNNKNGFCDIPGLIVGVGYRTFWGKVFDFFFHISADKLPEIAWEAVVVFSGSLLLHVFKMSLTL